MKSRLKNLARNLRKNQTPQEMKMWARLRDRKFKNLKFRRQYSIGKYIVDFICLEKNIIIEIDGWQHEKEFSGEKEVERTRFLENQGFKVLRFWNGDVKLRVCFWKLRGLCKLIVFSLTLTLSLRERELLCN